MKSSLLSTIAVFLLTLVVVGAAFIGCSSTPESQAEREARWTAGNLNEFETENGIGPVTEEVKLGPVDAALAEQGKAIFVQKCATCHYLDIRKTGPPLRDITKRRTAAYVLNQIQNAEMMGKLHPDGKKMVAQYAQYMTIQGITPENAKQLLEFLRSEVDKPALPAEQQPGFGTPPPPPDTTLKK